MSKEERSGQIRYTLRLDSAEATALREVASRYGTTQRAVIEEALRFYLTAETATRTDGQMAPLINRVIQDQHQVLGKGLRSLMARVGHEIMRTQYVLYNFMAAAGIPQGKVETWRSDGWHYAVKEFKQKPPDESASDA